jgi:hypothetical protein
MIKEYTASGLLIKLVVRIHSLEGRILGKKFLKIIAATRSCALRDKAANRTWSSRWESVGGSGTLNGEEVERTPTLRVS